MAKYIQINDCLGCPFYKEENNVYRNGTVGYVSYCNKLNEEIEFTDKMDTPKIYEKISIQCPLPNLYY